ncbi:MAG: hypothetical protein J1F04_08420 [Oscillospiraceae bacterium]|nr:hypothetical protein [Oscillospiraceae bacterium]
MAIRFKNEKHEERYNEILARMGKPDVYRKSAAYLITLDSECYKHIDSLYDFDRNEIKPFGALEMAWQTGTSVHTTRLIFNLWNGCSTDFDREGEKVKDSERYYSAEHIFSSCLGYWYFEAIKLRYPRLAEGVEE